MATLILAKTRATEFLMANTKDDNLTPKEPGLRYAKKWRPPMVDYIKINSDAAFDASTGRGACGIICRDRYGRVLIMATHRIYANSPLVAEALCLREAMRLGQSLSIVNVVFEADNLPLVNACRTEVTNREIQGIVDDSQSQGRV